MHIFSILKSADLYPLILQNSWFAMSIVSSFPPFTVISPTGSMPRKYKEKTRENLSCYVKICYNYSNRGFVKGEVWDGRV